MGYTIHLNHLLSNPSALHSCRHEYNDIDQYL
jgi:hypothetical protein